VTLSVLGIGFAPGCASDPKQSASPATGASGSGTAPSAANGAAGGSATAPSAGSGASGVDCTALPLPTNQDDVIATFEDGTGAVIQGAGRGGGFYMFNDGTGMQTPATGALPPATAVDRCGSKFALCMSGKNFTTWGAGMGTDFAPTAAAADGGMGAKMTYDASQYKGVAFWAKVNTAAGFPVRVGFKDKDTAPEGGQCDATATSGATACNDDWGKGLTLTTAWQPYTITFAELRQSGWGKAATSFAPQAVYSIQFQVNQGIDFDLCVDDLSFVR
jgi:hypothetical protein